MGSALQPTNTKDPASEAYSLGGEPAIDCAIRTGPPDKDGKRRKNRRKTEEGDLRH